MSTNDSNSRSLSRRQWIRMVGASGLAAAASATGVGTRSALAATSAQDDSPEGFIAYAFSQRAQAMTTRKTSLIEDIYDTSNQQLLAFEKDRASFMADLGSRWNGGRVLDYSTTASLISLQLNGTTATAQVYEWTRMLWIPRPVQRTRAEMAWRRQNPEKFSFSSANERGEVVSGFGNRHELKLEKHASGWRIVSDSYEEPDLYGASPDIMPGSWSAVRTGLPANSSLRVPNAPAPEQDFSTNACYSYNWSAARSYATYRCSTYNTAYCNYNPCGGDCANFVSQCFRAGNQVNGGAWYTFSGGCGVCGTRSSNAGTDTWANNYYLRNWVINSGRGVAKGSIGELGVGDIVNYDWTGNGSFDHVTFFSDSTNDLICSHNSDRCNTYWTMGGAARYLFTWLHLSYCA